MYIFEEKEKTLQGVIFPWRPIFSRPAKRPENSWEHIRWNAIERSVKFKATMTPSYEAQQLLKDLTLFMQVLCVTQRTLFHYRPF